MAKIYRVIQIKLNQLVSENVHVTIWTQTYNQRVFIAITVTNISQTFYLQDGSENQVA